MNSELVNEVLFFILKPVNKFMIMHSCIFQFKRIQSLLEVYLEKFRNRLGACNRRYIQTLMVLAQAFIQLLQQNASVQNTSGDGTSDSSMTINELLFSLDIDNINLVKLRRYIIESRIAHKVYPASITKPFANLFSVLGH